MPIFPTQYSMLSTSALRGHLEDAYGLCGMTCKLLVHNVSDTYILQNENEKYIFKLYRDRHRKLEEIEAEVEFINILGNKGAKVSRPISDQKGRWVQTFEGAEGVKNGVLFSFAKGRPTHDFYETRLQTTGREMARIHNVSANVDLGKQRKTYDIDTTLTRPLVYIKPEFSELSDDYSWLTKITALVTEKVSQFDTSKFAHGYCHYDFLPHNFHFDDHDNITFFDFDFLGKGLLVNDLMTFFVHFFFEVQFSKMTQKEADLKFAIFLAAYKEVRPVSEEEIAAIPYLGFGFWMFFLEFYQLHFEDWSNTFYNLRFKRERMTWIRNWVEWYCKF
jgi:Ser/Thr protein kinase RdoA (MazF antagonist)